MKHSNLRIKRNTRWMLTILCVCFTGSLSAGNPPNPANGPLKGRVTCAEKGIAKVVVTDGTHFTLTDKKGYYTLPATGEATHVYISSPSGYTVPVDNSVPLFWVPLRQVKNRQHIDFRLQRLPYPDDQHAFVAIGDPQVRNNAEVNKLKPLLEALATDLKTLGPTPLHVMIAGDLVFNRPALHEASKACFATLGLPVYNAIGNHDHVFDRSQTPDLREDKVADSVYIRHYGPTDYSFNRGRVHYLVMDNILFKGGSKAIYDIGFTPEQLAWAKNDLSYVPKDKAVIVMIHAPSKRPEADSVGNCNQLRALLKGFACAQIISGHTHNNNVMADTSGIIEHIIGAACGGFWEGPVCTDGTRMGYKFFQVDGTNIRWKYHAYAASGLQFTVSAPGERSSDLEPVNQLLVNVWDWDPAWQVTYSEDGGQSWKSMAQITEGAYDPTAYCYFGKKGDGLIPGRSFIGARKTDHIFRCTPAPGLKNVIIKTVSRFGEECRQLIELH